jgi:signal transduction histidine kinase
MPKHEEAVSRSSAPLRGRVWLVDDSPLEAQQARALLTAHHDVRLFTDGASFLEAFAQNAAADVVILDWRMPHVSGLEACRFLRERYDEVTLPILVLTASTEPEDRAQALAAGANDFVNKPYDDLELLARVRTLVRVRKQAEAQRERVNFEHQFVGIVSHDLRTPLAAIRLSSETMLCGEALDTRTRLGLGRIRMAAEHSLSLVRDLLDFTRARMGGGIPVACEPLDLHALVRGAVEEIRAAHPGREVRLEAEGDGQGTWDGHRMTQVVQNLVDNALEYSPAHTPVRVTTRGADGEVLLQVHNDGAPIAAELLPSLFEPLVRGTSGSDPLSRSVGLGLYIVKHLVGAHDGTVEVQSAAPEGTTFTVHLPRG